MFAWLGNYRRLVVRYARQAENYPGFVQLGCVMILLRVLCNGVLRAPSLQQQQ